MPCIPMMVCGSLFSAVHHLRFRAMKWRPHMDLHMLDMHGNMLVSKLCLVAMLPPALDRL